MTWEIQEIPFFLKRALEAIRGLFRIVLVPAAVAGPIADQCCS